jgi:hypothetical protein
MTSCSLPTSAARLRLPCDIRLPATATARLAAHLAVPGIKPRAAITLLVEPETLRQQLIRREGRANMALADFIAHGASAPARAQAVLGLCCGRDSERQ